VRVLTETNETSCNTRSEKILFGDLPNILSLGFGLSVSFIRLLQFLLPVIMTGGQVVVFIVDGDSALRGVCGGVGLEVSGDDIHFRAVVGNVVS